MKKYLQIILKKLKGTYYQHEQDFAKSVYIDNIYIKVMNIY